MKHITPRRLAVATLLAFGAGLAPLAQAMPSAYTITVTGTITDGEDLGGLFGFAPNTNHLLTGEAFSAVYTVNTQLGHILDNDPETRSIYGGTATPYLGPVSAVLTIHGSSFTLLGQADSGNVRIKNMAAVQDLINTHVKDGDPTFFYDQLNTDVQSLKHAFLPSLALDSAFSYTLQPDDFASGSFVIKTTTPAGSPYNYYEADGRLSIQTISVASLGGAVPSVPEPGSLMLCGVGLAAISLARRRRRD